MKGKAVDENRDVPVLLVDDDKMYTLALKRFLQRKSIPVCVCHSPFDALDRDPSILRAAVLDVYIEGDMDGLKLLQKLRHLQEELPVIVITGMASDDVRVAVKEYRANYFLSKPFRLARIFKILDELLNTAAKPDSLCLEREILLAHGGQRSDLLLDFLSSAGYRVILARNDEEAIREIEERPLIAGVVLQESLPGGASLVAQRAKSLGFGDSVLVAADSGEIVPKHWRPKNCPRLELPVGPDEFLSVLRSLLADDAFEKKEQAA